MLSKPTSTHPVARTSASPARARTILLAWLGLALGFVAITLSPLKSGFAERARFDRPGDVALYNSEIRRMRQGENYYQAAAAELRGRGFPTRSVFNWRTPAPMWLIVRCPVRPADS